MPDGRHPGWSLEQDPGKILHGSITGPRGYLHTAITTSPGNIENIDIIDSEYSEMLMIGGLHWTAWGLIIISAGAGLGLVFAFFRVQTRIRKQESQHNNTV